VGAVTEERDHGAEDGDDGDGYGDWDGERVAEFVFFVFREFDAFGHFCWASFQILKTISWNWSLGEEARS
jgi:hypothetical protein